MVKHKENRQKKQNKNRKRHNKTYNQRQTQQHTKLRPLREILVNRFTYRVQLVVDHWTKTIKLCTKTVKIYLYTVDL